MIYTTTVDVSITQSSGSLTVTPVSSSFSLPTGINLNAIRFVYITNYTPFNMEIFNIGTQTIVMPAYTQNVFPYVNTYGEISTTLQTNNNFSVVTGSYVSVTYSDSGNAMGLGASYPANLVPPNSSATPLGYTHHFSGTFTSANEFILAASANPNRSYMLIQNTAGVTMFFRFGGIGNGFILNATEGYENSVQNNPLITDDIYVMCGYATLPYTLETWEF